MQTARSKGLLAGGRLTLDQVHEAGGFARFADQQALIDAEWKVVERTAGELRESCPQLYKLLVLRTTSGRSPSILAVAVRYYFRREVEADQELFRGLAVAKWEALQEAQAKGFAALNEALQQHSQRVEEWIIGIDEKIKRLEDLIKTALGVLPGIQSREVRPSDSLSIRSDAERLLVRQVIEAYRALPAEQRAALPGIRIDIGKVRVAAGDFEEAQRDFEGAADKLDDPKRQGEAHYNAYQAALQRQAWVGALASIKQAIALDAARWAPFPEEYEPTRILGAGGFGVAFLCHHRFMNDDVVVKTLQTDELDTNVDRVFTEAQALKQLDHPSIIRVSTCGYADPRGKSRPYLAMDYFDGINLDSYVAEQGPLSPDELLAVAVPVAEALQAAHARGILHRDVKPANILVKRAGDNWRVRLIDFGLALRPAMLEGQASTSGPKAQTTMGKTIAGTLYYAAPEQMGQSPDVPVGPYSDVYGFGKTCYYALFRDPNPGYEDQVEADLPENWRLFLSKCTRKEVAKRLPDFAAVLAALQEAVRNPPTANGNPPGDYEKHWRENHPGAVACADWYLALLTEVYHDAWRKFAKTVITMYVGDRVRAAIWPKKNDRVLVTVERFNKEDLAEAVAHLDQQRIDFTTDKMDRLRFDVDLRQLKENRAAHEWLARRLLPGAAPPGGGEDGVGGPDETHDEQYWRDNAPKALECALWYRRLLTQAHGAAPIKFGKRFITIYVAGLVRVGIQRRKGGALITVRYSQDRIAEAVEYLTKAGVDVTAVKEIWLDIRTDLPQLKDKEAAHKWLVERLPL